MDYFLLSKKHPRIEERWLNCNVFASDSFHLFNPLLMQNNHINYVEFKAHDLEQTKRFYQQAFGWTFVDYGPTYTAFERPGLDGGFEKTTEPILNGALVILYHDDLESALGNVIQAGGRISQEIFSFPGGRRFHFLDPSGNELAVWSD